MPVIIEWDDDSYQIICVKVSDNWSLDEAYTLSREVYPELLEQTTFVPDIIIDCTESGQVSSVGILRVWQEAFGWSQTLGLSSSLILFVQAPPILRSAGGTLRNLRLSVMRNTFFVDTIEEAREKIRSHRQDTPSQTLPPSST